MSETPRPRPSRGVMGYVAELQQFDPVPPYVYELVPPGPAIAAVPAPAPPAPLPVPPRAATVTIVSHIRQQSQRRIRAAMIAGAVVVILTGAGLSYAALGGPDDAPRAQAPAVATSGAPADGSLPLDPVLPGAEPVDGRPTAPATTTTGAAPGGTTGTTEQFPDDTTLPAPVLPGLPDPPQPTLVATEGPTDPAPTRPPAAPAAPLPLTATFSHVADAAEDGFLGYAGTVRITNPGSRDVTGWRVTLTVPSGNPVTAAGASVGQDGETVTFTPDGDATVPAGGVVTFSFEVAGLLAALPGGCAIDGAPCS